MERHHIDSDEFEQWEADVDMSTGLNDPITASREDLYDMWVEGYSAWEVAAILG